MGVFVIAWYLVYSHQSHSDIAIAVATVFGLALTATGTQIGIIAISKSHEAIMMQHRLTEIDITIKHYNERTWTRIASESVIKSRELASKLYEDIIEHIKMIA